MPARSLSPVASEAATMGVVAVAKKLNTTNARVNSAELTPSAASASVPAYTAAGAAPVVNLKAACTGCTRDDAMQQRLGSTGMSHSS